MGSDRAHARIRRLRPGLVRRGPLRAVALRAEAGVTIKPQRTDQRKSKRKRRHRRSQHAVTLLGPDKVRLLSLEKSLTHETRQLRERVFQSGGSLNFSAFSRLPAVAGV